MMSVQETTEADAGLEGESESGLNLKKEQLPLTEDEGTFKGPTFCPPVYRRRYAAVCELVKKYQAKKVPPITQTPSHLVFPSSTSASLMYVNALACVACPKVFGF